MLVVVIRNSLLLMGVTMVAFILVQESLEPFTTALKSSKNEQPVSEAAPPDQSSTEEETASQNGTLIIEAGPGGHYFVDAEIDGREIGFLVDTGATMIALTQTDAETIGYPIHQLDYSGRANTANGVARFAPIMIEEIVIGDNIIRNVRGVIIDAPMQKSLLGMTFLRKLSGFEVKGGKLILRW